MKRRMLETCAVAALLIVAFLMAVPVPAWGQEGEATCEIDGGATYFYLLVGFGDLDGDDTISQDELAAITGWPSFVIQLGWSLIDTNGDNEISVDEYTASSWLSGLLPSLDANSDNQLTLAEVQTLDDSISQGDFDAVDVNGNGVIDCEDFYGASEGEGTAEGAEEGQIEGEGAAEGSVEGSVEGEGAVEGAEEGEGQGECEIDGTESYYYLLIAFGDLDGDSTLSADELIALTGWNETVVNIGWSFIDSDGNGELTLSEFMTADWLLNLLPGLDTNSDNVLSLSEIQTLASGVTQDDFDAVDTNGNGAIDCVDLYGGAEGEGAEEGQVEGEGVEEGQVEGEGAEEGQMEGEGVAEGQVEGESCILGACPDFDTEGTAFFTQLAAVFQIDITWTYSDIDVSLIVDSWEVALFQAVLCSTDAAEDDPTVCTFLANLATLRTEPNYSVVQSYENVIAALLSISTEMQATVKTLGLSGMYEVALIAEKAVGEPFSAQGDPDGDGLSNLEEFNATVAGGLAREDYVIAALTPNATEGTEEGVVEGAEEGGIEGQPEGVEEGAVEGTEEGAVEGAEEGAIEGAEEGAEEGAVEGAEEGVLEGAEEGVIEGTAEGVEEGAEEGAVEGAEEGETPFHSADQDQNNQIGLSELLRVIQFYNSGGLHCQAGTEDGYAPGTGDTSCLPHSSDYNPQDWAINISELLRVIQFYNSGGYHICEEGEDGFCPGLS